MCPSSRLDLWSADALRSPYAAYDELRAIGPVVYLPDYDLWAVTRYDQVRAVLADWERFTSVHGVGMNDVINSQLGILGVDPPLHDVMRGVLTEQLAAKGIRALNDRLQEVADRLVRALVAKGSFDAVTELAEVYPVSIVADLIGLPEESWSQLLPFAAAAFMVYGPMNEHTEAALPAFTDFLTFCAEHATRDRLRPGSWGAAAYEAADRGVIPSRMVISFLAAYIGAGMDTTISAVASALMLLGLHPDAYARLKDDERLIPATVLETLRLESPVQKFTRVTRVDWEVDGAVVPTGSRLLILYGSANRDERKYPDPHRFDIDRKPTSHVAFGYGLHTCAGQFLARSEVVAVLNAMTKYVPAFEVAEPVWQINNIGRRLGSLPLRVP